MDTYLWCWSVAYEDSSCWLDNMSNFSFLICTLILSMGIPEDYDFSGASNTGPPLESASFELFLYLLFCPYPLSEFLIADGGLRGS